MNSSPGDRLRVPRSVALLIAAFVSSLFLVTSCTVSDDSTVDALGVDGAALTDQQAAAQVVDSARQIVTAAHLTDATGGYTFMSCKNESEPPYQAALYMNFRLPQTNSAKYLSDVAATLVAHGWTDAPSMSKHFGEKLTKDGVTSVFYRDVNDADVATMRLYGECRNMADHRNDNPAWTDVSDQLG
jgi:hypothetical protein